MAQGPQVCHSEERSDVGISCNRLRFRRGLPAIQHGTARLPRRLRLLAMTHQAVQRCTRALLRLNFPRTGRSLSAATDAIGLYVLSFSVRTDSAFPRLPRRLRLLAMTNPGASAFHFKFLYTTSPMRHTREALMKAARADGERFFTETRLEKRGNTLCTRKGHAASVRRQSRQRLRNISSFSSRWIGEKDPAAAADDFVRASQKKHAEGCT